MTVTWLMRLQGNPWMHTMTVLFRPAPKSAIENLEKVRISNDLDAMRHKSCVICLEGFGHDSEAAGVDDHQVLRLPCSHVYHGD
ncbi:hypothetical protein COP2_015949 [Malus domestica]